MWKLLTIIAVIAAGFTGFLAWSEIDDLSNLLVTLAGSFWGFLLAQAGLALYESIKEREELLAMMTSTRTELLMNKATVGWISHLLSTQQEQVNVHGLGFADTDKISIAAIQNLVSSPLTYKWASRSFAAKPLLTIYQTLLVIEREIPTANVGISNSSAYGRIKFFEVDKAFDTLIEMLDHEASRLHGKARWSDIVRMMEAELPRTIAIRQTSEPKIERLSHRLEAVEERLSAIELNRRTSSGVKEDNQPNRTLNQDASDRGAGAGSGPGA